MVIWCVLQERRAGEWTKTPAGSAALAESSEHPGLLANGPAVTPLANDSLKSTSLAPTQGFLPQGYLFGLYFASTICTGRTRMEKNSSCQGGEAVGMITQRLGRQSLGEEDRPPHLMVSPSLSLSLTFLIESVPNISSPLFISHTRARAHTHTHTHTHTQLIQ